MLLKGAGRHAVAAPPPASPNPNIFKKTEQVDDSEWQKIASTVSANATTAPDGTTTADKLIETATNAQHRVDLPGINAGLANFAANTPHTMSVHVKAAERGWTFVLGEFGPGNFQGHYVNLTTGAIGSQYSSGATTVVEAAANGFWRIGVTANTDAAPGNVLTMRVYVCTANGTNSHLGDGTSGIYVWGAKLEVASAMTAYNAVA